MDNKERKPRWGKHMQIPQVRDALFELSKSLNPPAKKNPQKKVKPRE